MEPTPSQPDDDITVTTNLLSVPHFAEQLGHLCVAWANLEWHMYNVYEVLSGSPPSVARAAFYSLESNRGRRDMITGVSAAVLDRSSPGSNSEHSPISSIAS